MTDGVLAVMYLCAQGKQSSERFSGGTLELAIVGLQCMGTLELAMYASSACAVMAPVACPGCSIASSQLAHASACTLRALAFHTHVCVLNICGTMDVHTYPRTILLGVLPVQSGSETMAAANCIQRLDMGSGQS